MSDGVSIFDVMLSFEATRHAYGDVHTPAKFMKEIERKVESLMPGLPEVKAVYGMGYPFYVKDTMRETLGTRELMVYFATIRERIRELLRDPEIKTFPTVSATNGKIDLEDRLLTLHTSNLETDFTTEELELARRTNLPCIPCYDATDSRGLKQYCAECPYGVLDKPQIRLKLQDILATLMDIDLVFVTSNDDAATREQIWSAVSEVIPPSEQCIADVIHQKTPPGDIHIISEAEYLRILGEFERAEGAEWIYNVARWHVKWGDEAETRTWHYGLDFMNSFVPLHEEPDLQQARESSFRKFGSDRDFASTLAQLEEVVSERESNMFRRHFALLSETWSDADFGLPSQSPHFYSQGRFNRNFKRNVMLHAHTNLSDGDLSPEEAIRVFKERGFYVVSFTDHDNLECARTEFDDPDVVVIPGIELSLQRGIHLLGYGFDPNSAALTKQIDDAVIFRLERTARIVDFLEDAGYDISMQQIIDYKSERMGGEIHDGTLLITKPDIVGTLISNNESLNWDDEERIYEALIRPVEGDGSARLSLEEGIQLIQAAGGKAGLAHPGEYWLKTDRGIDPMELIEESARGGADFVEVMYPYSMGVRSEYISAFMKKTLEMRLMPIGGVDFHSFDKPPFEMFWYDTMTMDTTRKLLKGTHCEGIL